MHQKRSTLKNNSVQGKKDRRKLNRTLQLRVLTIYMHICLCICDARIYVDIYYENYIVRGSQRCIKLHQSNLMVNVFALSYLLKHHNKFTKSNLHTRCFVLP